MERFNSLVENYFTFAVHSFVQLLLTWPYFSSLVLWGSTYKLWFEGSKFYDRHSKVIESQDGLSNSPEGTLKEGLEAFENSQDTIVVGFDQKMHAIEYLLTKNTLDNGAQWSQCTVQIVGLFRSMDEIKC